ncbi:MAG: MFS transporter [Dehalococcoidia bacterium]
MRAPRTQRISAIRALYDRPFRFFWANALFSFGAINMQQLARSFLARDLTESPFLVTSVFALGSMPLLFAPLLGGVLADRMDRKRLVMALDAAQALLSLALALMLTFGVINIPILMGFSVGTGSIMGLSLPVRQAMIPDTTAPESATNALVLFSGVFSIMMVLAPSIAGQIIGVAGVDIAIFTTVGLFVPALFFLSRVPGGTSHIRRQGAPMIKEMVEGFRYVRRSKSLPILMISGILGTVLYLPYISLMPIFQRDVLDVGASGLGLMFTATGAGAVFSSVLMAFFSTERPNVGFMMLFGIGAGLAIAAFSQSSSFGLSLGILALVGLGQTGFMTMGMALVQYLTPAEMRGRVMAIRMLVFGMLPMGTVLAGLGAEVSSPQAALAVLGLTGVAAQILTLVWMRKVPMTPPAEARLDTAPGD